MSEHWRGTGRTNTTSVSIVHICTERPCHPVWMLPRTITTHTPIQPVQSNCWPLCRVLLCCTRIWLHYVARLCSWSFSKIFLRAVTSGHWPHNASPLIYLSYLLYLLFCFCWHCLTVFCTAVVAVFFVLIFLLRNFKRAFHFLLLCRHFKCSELFLRE